MLPGFIQLSQYCVSTHVSTAYQDTKGMSRLRSTYVSIRYSYSSIHVYVAHTPRCYLCHIFTYQRRIARVSMKIAIRRGLRRILFKRRMYHVRVTYLLRSCGVSVTFCISMEFLFRMYGVSRCMCYVRVTYVWRMKRTRDVSTMYLLRSILICGVSVLYQLLFIAPAYSRVRYRSPNFRPPVHPSTFTSKFGFPYISDSCEYETLHSHCP